MQYNFAEKKFGPNFCKEVVKEITITISAGSSATIVGIRNIGITPLFRYVVMKARSNYIYVDVHELTSPNKEALFLSMYRELGGNNQKITSTNAIKACKELIYKLLQERKQIVIFINQIDYLRSEFSKGLFINLRSIEDVGRKRVVFIISATKPLYDYPEVDSYDRSLGFASKIIYFPLHTNSDLDEKIETYPMSLKPDKKDLEKILSLSGGHATIYHMLLKTEHFNNPLEGEVFQNQMKLIYDTYTGDQKSQLRKIAAGRRIKEVDPFLLKIGLVKEVDGRYELFTPLLRDYIIKYVQTKLSKKERLLFALFKKKLNKIVTKDHIIEIVWGETADEVTDWAINSLIYRLRKSQTLRSSDYTIENEKGEGYRMIQER